MQDYNWVIRTSDGTTIALIQAATFEAVYDYAVTLWNVITSPSDELGMIGTHCDGLMICQIIPGDEILGTSAEEVTWLQINYVTHER